MIEMCILCFFIVLMLNIDFYEFFIVNRQFNLLGVKTLNGLNKRDYKQHKKDCNDLRKEIRNYVDKDFGPWDNYTLYFLEIQIKYWIKYYSLGWNVWGQEERDAIKEGYFPMPEDGVLPPTRLEIAKTLQILLYRYVHFGLGLTDEELLEYEFNYDGLIKRLKEQEGDSQPVYTEGSFTIRWIKSSPIFKRTIKFRDNYRYVDEKGESHFDTDKYNEDYLKCKQELFDYYFKYTDYMWD